MKRIVTTALCLGLIFLTAGAQRIEGEKVREALESKNFVFKAEFVSPQRGTTRPLTPEYDLKVNEEKLVSFLPYFGRAFIAPVDPSRGPIQFTSEKFDYKWTKQKKNRWEVTIIPRDVSDVRELFLTIFDNGRASLRVNSNSRESISFTGYIGHIEKKDS